MIDQKIPFNKPCLEGKEIDNVLEAIKLGKLAGDGEFSRKCETEIAQITGSRRILLTSSGTDALELAALLCNIQPGDEVIMPSFTFVSTANAFCLRGASPKFVDIDTSTLNIDTNLIEEAITHKTKAIVPVHYAGVACDMDAICELKKKYDVKIVEDAAQGLFCTYKSKYLGTIGDLGCISFHESKTIMSGEGGAISINEPNDIERAEILREKGTNRAAFFREEVEKYTWIDIGSSFIPSDLTAAFLYGQIKVYQDIIAKREKIYNLYHDLLSPLAEYGVIKLPTIPHHCTINYHLFYILVENLEIRTKLLTYLNGVGIKAVFHYIPLHLSPYANKLGISVDLPVTESIHERIIRLPLYNCLTHSEQEYIVEKIYNFFNLIKES